MRFAPALLLVSLPLGARAESGVQLPPLEIAKGLPSKETAEAMIAFSDEFRKGYARGWHGHDIISWNRWFWDRLARVQDVRYPDCQRRHYLGELIDWLGWGRVLTGDMPPAVPLELIPEAKR